MFEKNLQDLVKGIRASKRDTALYISQCIAEIKTELNSSDMFVKANALQKLTFLHMMGYSMSWASFATIEVMSSPRFAHKRIGYLSASQGFTRGTDVILLTTNLLKKELQNSYGTNSYYQSGLALNCLSNIVNEDLARDLLPEVTNLTAHPQPYIRKKAILCLFKLFVQYPQGLRLTFAKIQEALEKDPNPSVVSCAVNVITELSDKNPKNYLYLAPSFFQLLTSSSNNWMLIKVVKLLASLVPQEPRLARKLLEPLSNIVKTTQAKSLLYEAVQTITICLIYSAKSDGTLPASVPAIVTLCANMLRSFVEEKDQNLKYLGLVGFGSLRKSHPKILSASEYRPLILQCLSDEDVTIRTRALHLLTGMATMKNLRELVVQLLGHVALATGPYKHELVENIVEMCSAEKYARIPDFAWYFDILLLQLGHLRGLEAVHGELLRSQITNVALRVLPVRRHAVQRSMQVLLGRGDRDEQPLVGASAGGDTSSRGRQIIPEILPSLAWIVGEYADFIRECKMVSIPEDNQGIYHDLILSLIKPSNSQALLPSTQKVYVQASMKVFSAATANEGVTNSELEACVRALSGFLPIYTQSIDVEVQERAFTSHQLLKTLRLSEGYPAPTRADGDGAGATGQKDRNINGSLGTRCREESALLNYLFKPEPMKPISAKIQRKKLQCDPAFYEAPVDLSIFSELIEEEEVHRAGNRLTLEAVSFTQQRPMRVAPERPINMAMDVVSSMDVPNIPSTSTSGTQKVSTTSSFQNMAANAEFPGNQRKGDPFYLDAPAATSTEEKDLANRFGTIQLLDSDDDEVEVRKAKKKKTRKPKKKAPRESSLQNNGMGSLVNPAVYASDEDDADDHRLTTGPKGVRSKELDGLAKVDLTTPLRPDEVMPMRTHRQVPDRTPEVKKEKKTKRKSTKKLKKPNAQATSSSLTPTNTGSAVGDLLNLGGPPLLPTALPTPTELMPANPTHIISTAFDDLLDMAAVPSAPLPSFGLIVGSGPASQSTVVGSTQDLSRPWMKAIVKITSAVGSSVDWSKLSVFYKVYPGDSSAQVVARIDNLSSTAIDGLKLSLKGCVDVDLGTLNGGSSLQSGKVGPLPFAGSDASQEIKGLLSASNSNVPIKMVLPASLRLRERHGLSLDLVMNELNSMGWSSSSAKLEVDSGVSNDTVIPTLCSFLNAALVEPESSSSTSATLAAESVEGAQVRVLVKVKERSVKIDLKSSNAALGKALASDIKKLVL